MRMRASAVFRHRFQPPQVPLPVASAPPCTCNVFSVVVAVVVMFFVVKLLVFVVFTINVFHFLISNMFFTQI